MIKIIADNNTFKIKGVEYENNGFKKNIEIKVLTVTSSTDENNIGTILEKYRENDTNLNEYFSKKKDVLEQFICDYTKPFDKFKLDGIICISTGDKNRSELLSKFKNKLTSETLNKFVIDYSDKFSKKDKSKSIKRDNLTGLDFDFSVSNSTPFKNLLIIDDVIDEGKTLEILLDKLLSQKLIDNMTEIKMGCIYNRPKTNKSIVSPLQAYKNRKNNENEKPIN